MKAYKIEWADVKQRRMVDMTCRFNLPRVECPICCPEWKNWGDGLFEYPAFKFSFLNEQEFTDRRVLSLDEFSDIRLKIQNAAGRPVNIIPGASIGELSGTTISTKLEDFIWGRLIVPQISKRAKDILASESIDLFTTECSIQFRGRQLTSHLAVQVEPVPLMTEESLARHKIFHCPRCGNFVSPSPRLSPIISEGYLIKKSNWPKDQHLVQMQETLHILASEKFIETVKRYKLSGITFEECGLLV